VKLDAYYDDLLTSLTQIADIASETSEDSVILIPHCDICEFRNRCRSQATELDHLSLLKGMTEKEVRRHNSKGIFTINQLSYTFRSRRPRKRTQQESKPHNFALQALAIRKQQVFVHGDYVLPDARVRVFVDFEGVPDRNAVYLIGTVVERDDESEYVPFWADSLNDEVQLFQSFLDWLPPTHDMQLYHFGSYEAKAFQRMAHRLSANSQKKVESVRARMTNVLSIIHQHIYFPAYSNSLKDIAEVLGFTWSDAASDGKTSIIWRHEWEQTRDESLKERLVRYNRDDCHALQRVMHFIRHTTEMPKGGNSHQNGALVVESTDTIRSSPTNRHRFGRFDSVIEELNAINKCAYFDYQRNKARVGSGKSKRARNNRGGRRKLKQRANTTTSVQSRRCVNCGTTKIKEQSEISRQLIDLRFGPGYVKKWITEFHSYRYECKSCSASFVPIGLPDGSTKYGHGLVSWCVYNHIIGGQTMLRVQRGLSDVFHLKIPHTAIWRFKKTVRTLIEPDLQRNLKDLMSGEVLYIDETEVKLRRSKGCVWVFANADRVHYEYRESRSAEFLHEFLEAFNGVVVSDFFTGYDSLAMPQQKCLIHLIRDMNADLLERPFDDEFRSIVDRFAKMFRLVTQTIDRFGLKRRHLRKHKSEASRLFGKICNEVYASDVAQKYQARIVKYGDRMLTFMEYDGVSWNNNLAENAVKPFARFRRFADGRFTESSVKELLAVMSVFQSLERQEIDPLRFLQELAPEDAQFDENAVSSPGFGDRPEETEIVDRMIALRKGTATRDRMTYDQIAQLLNSESVPTRRGGRWWGTTVRAAIRRARRNRRSHRQAAESLGRVKERPCALMMPDHIKRRVPLLAGPAVLLRAISWLRGPGTRLVTFQASEVEGSNRRANLRTNVH
jgi:uncharacterized protein YprB with RNaseH-like and TPR domain